MSEGNYFEGEYTYNSFDNVTNSLYYYKYLTKFKNNKIKLRH